VDVLSATLPLLLLIVDVGSPYEIVRCLLQAVDCRPIIYIIGSELARTAEADRLLASAREWVGSGVVQSAGLAPLCRRSRRKRLAILSILPYVSPVPPDASNADGEFWSSEVFTRTKPRIVGT
jgi:hypothetical protein